MKHIGRAVATIAILGGIAGLSYLFNSFAILSGVGAGLMIFAGLIVTAWVWEVSG